MVVSNGSGIFARVRAAAIFGLLVAGGAVLLRHDSQRPAKPFPALSVTRAASVQLPLSFEPNQGQAAASVRFLARGAGYGIYLTRASAVLAIQAPRHAGSASVEMRFPGANRAPELTTLGTLPGHSNYLIGNDPNRWRTGIPQYSRVRYHDLYPGIDLDFYGRQGQLEYDFEVAPGRDPRRVELDLRGATPRLDANGDLILGLEGRGLRFQAPHIYQESAGVRKDVAGAFVLRGGSRVGFEVGNYDRSRTLVIDPVLTFSTFLGGSNSESCAAIVGAAFVPHCPAVAVDSAARIYVAGSTLSPLGSFPGATSSPPSPNGGADVFITRISNSGAGFSVDFVTYLGGSGTEYPAGIGVDSGFNVYVAGTTTSSDFPTVNGIQLSASGTHAFFTKLNSSASANLYSTYIAGSGTDSASGLAVDSQGIAYVLGTTTSQDLQTTTGSLQPLPLAANQFYFIKLNPNNNGASSKLYWTYIGGSTPSGGIVTGGGIAVDSKFNVYLAGGTDFADMPLVNAFQATPQGGLDVWAAALKAPANNTQQYTPLYETYFGGSGSDVAYGVATDGTNTYVTGQTDSTITPPSGTTAFQATLGGAKDAFVAKFGVPTTTGTTTGSVPLVYFTYLGGSNNDAGLDIAADQGTSSGNVRVTGFTASSNFPVANNPVQGSFGGGSSDAFVARILTTTNSSTGNSSSSSFLGGGGSDIGTGIALDPLLNTYVVGETTSGNFPLSNAVQGSLSGASDAFVSKLGPSLAGLSFTCPTSVTGCPNPSPSNPTVNPTPVGVGNQITFKYSIYNLGEPVPGVVFTDLVGQNSSITSIAETGGSSCSTVSSGNTSAVCALGTINTSSTTTSGSTTTVAAAATVTVNVTAIPPSITGSQPPKPPDIGNSGVLTVTGTNFQQTASGTASVNDFGVSAQTVTGVVTAGATASYNITVTPTGPIPSAVSLACGTGLPAQSHCSFSSSSSIPNLNNGPASRIMDISTTARVTTPASLFEGRGWSYAFWLPVSGLALIGSGVSRRRRWLLGLLIAILLGTVALQAGCGGSGGGNRTTTTGTPAGTYTITVNAASGTATRSTTVQLVVQ